MTTAHGTHIETIPLFVTPGLRYIVILRMPWFESHNPTINWTDRNITFSSQYCREHCLKTNNGNPITIETCNKSEDNEKAILVTSPKTPPVINTSRLPSASNPHKPDLTTTTKKIFTEKPIPIGAVAFNHLAHKPHHDIFTVSLHDIEQALQPKVVTGPATILPTHYHEFLSVFSKANADKLPPHRPGIDHEIKLRPDTQPPSGPLYGMSRDELEVLKKYLTENLDKGFIRASSAVAAAPVLFV